MLGRAAPRWQRRKAQQNIETSPLRGFIVSGISKIIISRSPLRGLFYLRPSIQLTNLSINAMDEAHLFNFYLMGMPSEDKMSAESLTVAAAVASGTTGVTFAAMFPEATPAVMLCALAGAAMYVLTAEEHRLWKQAVFALISFVAGVFFAATASEILAGILNSMLGVLTPPVQVKVSPAIGALVASTISVVVLLRILAKSKTASPRLEGGDE